MSELDIIARLQLRGEQFSSETGQRFAEMKSRAASAAQDIRREFGSSFAEVQKLASTALQLPRTAGGSLDLSSEITQLRQAAAASDTHAQALRELSIAQTAAAGSARVDAQAMKLEADASAVGALAAEREAQAHRDRAAALEIVQNELNRTTSATKVHGQEVLRGTDVNGQARAGMQQLGFQLNDIAVQYAAGTNASIIFAQQSGQVIQALQLMTTKTSGFLGFLGGPWGIALGTAAVVLTPFVAKLFEGGDALEEATEKLRKNTSETDINRRAQEQYNFTIEGRIENQRKLNEEMERGLRTQIQIEQANLDRSMGQERGATRGLAGLQRELKAAVDQRAALVERNRAGAGDARLAPALDAQIADLDGKIAAIKVRIGEVKTALQEAKEGVASAQIAIDERTVANGLDASTAATDKYTRALGRLREERKLGQISRAQFREQLRQAQVTRDAEIKAAQEAAQKNRPTPLGTQLRNDRASSLLSDAKQYSGLREGSAGLAALFSGANVRIDPEKTAWCAAFVQAVLAGQGIKGTGSMSARSYLGFGSAVTKPEPGDIVILKRPGGGAGAGHVGFYAGQGANGSVLVTGGNQGDRVSTDAFKRSDVLGFRRAPSGSEAYKAEQRELAAELREAAAAQREFMSTLNGLEDRYDPAAAAARRYREELAEITRLEGLAEGNPAKIGAQTAEGFRSGARAAYMKAVLPSPSGDGGITKFLEDTDRAREDQKRQAEQDFRELSDYYFDLFSGRTDDIWRRFKSLALGTIADSLAKSTLNDLLGVATPGKGKTGDDPATTELRKINGGLDRLGIKLPKDIGKTLIEGAGVGMIAGGVFGGITGGKQSQLGGAVGGALGEVAGKALGKSLGGLLGQAGGPLGAIAGGILGSAIGGLFKKTKSGSATLSIDNGSVGVGGTSGNSSSYRAAASGLAGGVGDSLTRIADALGGSLTGPIGVSIGKRKDSFVVDTTGRGKTKGAGTQKFDTEEAAIRAAISNALADGAIQGISDASKRILASGQKLETAIEKASMIEAIPKQLVAMLDPVGAALDELNEKWAKTVAALKEGGATTEQMAQAEQLYRLQLAETKATTQAASASLKDFLKSLSIGSNSPLSLRDQETAAMSALQPFLAQIDAGQRIDQDKYREAAQAYLDIERQLGGSTDRYFEQFSRIQDYTNRAIAAIDNAVPIREAKPDPFAQATASNTGTANELLAQISEQLRAIAEGGGGGGGGVLANAFIGGSPRGFANAA